MSIQLEQYDESVVVSLRQLALQGQSPSAIFRELKQLLGNETHILTLLGYFRRAFCLTLAEAKPLAALSRNEQRAVEDERWFDELLSPAIQSHRLDWADRAG